MRNDQHDKALFKANQAIKKSIEGIEDDPHRPMFHACPPINWMNDPNGLIFFQGEFHLFYQHNPYNPYWSHIHWGHMKSNNLIDWKHLPVALAPSEAYDCDGCFSGSAVISDDKLVVFYTANRFTSSKGLPDDLFQQQCMATSDDGIHFVKSNSNPVITSPPVNVGQNNHFRDPKVWQEQGIWYMVLGTKNNERGKVLLYRSNDLYQWDYVSVLTISDGTMGYMYECPDMISLGGKDILLYSPQGIGIEEQPNLSGYVIGEMNYSTDEYQHGAFYKLDHGFEYYAPQTMLDKNNRRILLGWMQMSVENSGKSWSGCMSLPRELKYSGGKRMLIQPVKELETLRKNYVKYNNINVKNQTQVGFDGISGDCVELSITCNLSSSSASEFGIHVRTSCDGKEKTTITYNENRRLLIIDRNDSGSGPKGIRILELAKDQEILKLHLFLDRCTFELFVNNGEYVMSGLIFPEPSSKGIQFFSTKGNFHMEQLHFWQLESSDIMENNLFQDLMKEHAE